MTMPKTDLELMQHKASVTPFNPTSGIAKTNVQEAIEAVLASAVADLAAHLADAADAHDASAISLADAGGLYAATEVEAGLAEVMTALNAHLADGSDAHDASAISFADSGNDYSATEVEAALTEVMDAHLAHLADATDAHDASAISVSPTGSLAATDVQAALVEILGDIEAHIADATDAHDASAISIADGGGYYTGTDIETALQEIGADIAALDQAVILKGTWDASSGSFPGGGAAPAGWSYIVSIGGTVDGQVFVANDRIVAITDNASTSTYAGNWHRLDYTDQVLSVAGKTGAVVIEVADISDATAAGRSILTYADPNTNAIIYWDDSSGAMASLTLDDTLEFSGDNLQRAALSGAIAATAGSNVTTATGAVAIEINGGGSAISTGVKTDLRFPFPVTLTAWTLLADTSGAIKIDLWKDTLANFPPTDADSITNGHEPEIAASGTNAEDTNISDWTDVTVDAGDVVRINVDSAATVTRVVLILHYTKTG